MILKNTCRFIVSLTSALVLLSGCAPTPASVEFEKDKYLLDGADAKDKIVAKVLDADGKQITEGINLVYFCSNSDIIKLDADGSISAVASGEAKVDVEVVGTTLTATVPVRVKIAASINLSHEKLRLWTGQVKDNVWSEVHSEKDAFIEGFKPEWNSEDPSIVKVEQINDPNRRQSWVKLTGMKSGNTYIITSFRHLTKSIKVRVYDDDEEVSLAGERLGKIKKDETAEEKTKPKKKKKKKKKRKRKWVKIKKKK